jgi:hypothetical protein
MHKIMVTIGLILGCFALTSLAAEIRVTTDRTSVNMDESFQVIFSASGDPDGEPDFSPLQKDFEILGQSQSNQSLMINGSFSSTIQWVVDVVAKKAGVLTIPAINFGQDKSTASTIHINKEDQITLNIKGKGGGDLFFLVDVSTETPYVQQQVIYTLRLYRKVNLSQARLTEPKLADAMIERLGEDKDYNALFQGERYSVTERKYAIFPQKSGTRTIAPLSLTAAVVVGNRSSGFSGFFSRQRTQTKRVVSDAVELNVRPVPKGFVGKRWLPAEQLHLQEEWSNDELQVNVGEPLTRTLTLLVHGATVGQLPELSKNQQNANGKLRNYRDQPLLKDQAKESGMIALREEKIALIPSQAGAYKLPEIEVSWWNTQTDQMEIAKIPAKTIQAIALQGSEKSEPTSRPISTDVSVPTQQVTDDSTPQGYAWVALSAFLGLGWLLTTLFLLKGRQNKIKSKKIDQTAKPVNNGVKDLKKACHKNDAVAAKDALIRWGQQQYAVSNLGKIAQFSASDLKQEILDLNQQLYSKQNSEWKGKELWQSFSTHVSNVKIEKPADDKLEPLYRL